MANDRASQRDRIIREFGVWIQPYRELAKSSAVPDMASYWVANGKLAGGAGELTGRVNGYLRLANDVSLEAISLRMNLLLAGFTHSVSGMSEAERTGDLKKLQADFTSALGTFENEFMRWLDRAPVNWEPEIFEANTPFTAYRRIQSAMVAAKQRVHYFDRYIKANFFSLFLDDLNRKLSIRLVTTAKSVKDVEPVSSVVRQEFTDYQLIEVDQKQMHDRNLRVDEQIFSLGPGVDRAGVALTNFGPADSSITAHGHLDALIGAGRVVHQS